jgi:polyhydroxyalkanoate synthase
MGGNLALALALRNRGAVAGLALLATPWDFHAERPEQARALAALGEAWLTAFAPAGAVPVDVLQSLFVWLDPLLGYRKMRHFAALDPDGDEARLFVALEDWLNDGVPLPLRAAHECFSHWYGENRTHRGTWRVDGNNVRPQDYTGPALTITPRGDRIVPPACAQALSLSLPRVAALEADAGHIGMMAGSRAERQCWQPVAEWIGRLTRAESPR